MFSNPLNGMYFVILAEHGKGKDKRIDLMTGKIRRYISDSIILVELFDTMGTTRVAFRIIGGLDLRNAILFQSAEELQSQLKKMTTP